MHYEASEMRAGSNTALQIDRSQASARGLLTAFDQLTRIFRTVLQLQAQSCCSVILLSNVPPHLALIPRFLGWYLTSTRFARTETTSYDSISFIHHASKPKIPRKAGLVCVPCKCDVNCTSSFSPHRRVIYRQWCSLSRGHAAAEPFRRGVSSLSFQRRHGPRRQLRAAKRRRQS